MTHIMTIDQFWQIIEDARGNAAKVTAALLLVPAEEIEAFANLYGEQMNRLHHWDIWGAAFVLNDGCSDDCFHYFKAFVIGKGRKFFEQAVLAPDELAPLITSKDLKNGCDNEALNYAAAEAYEQIANADLVTEVESLEGTEPAGETWEEDEVYDRFPKLAARAEAG